MVSSNQPETSYSYSIAEHERHYFWRVVARSADGTSAPSAVRSFQTMFDPPEWPEKWNPPIQVPDSEGSGRPVKSGAWLLSGPDAERFEDVLYVTKGNKTTDFFKYYPRDNRWVPLPPIPHQEGARPKPPDKGCAAAYGRGYLYMVKGNGTYEFWSYAMASNVWEPLPPVPVKSKSGSGIVYYPDDFKDGSGDRLYLLAGGKNAFFCYNVGAREWTLLDSAPYGGGKPKYAGGSFLVHDGRGTLYAHQSAVVDDSNHFMFRYYPQSEEWDRTPLKGLPLYGTEGGKPNKKKKSKDGGAGVWFQDQLYALKGGGSQGLYRYDVEMSRWLEVDTIPATADGKRGVKAGGSLAAWGNFALYILRGNKSSEMWPYVVPSSDRRTPVSGIAAGTTTPAEQRLGLVVNSPISKAVTLRVQGVGRATSRMASVRIFDAAGCCIFSRSLVIRSSSLTVPLDVSQLPSGVYTCAVTATGKTATRQFVVLR